MRTRYSRRETCPCARREVRHQSRPPIGSRVMRLGSRATAIALVGAAMLAPASAAGASSTAVLRIDGIGPLHLGMTRTAALATGWLGQRGSGCELGGRPFPITYRFTGRKAPHGIAGVAEFQHNKLT